MEYLLAFVNRETYIKMCAETPKMSLCIDFFSFLETNNKYNNNKKLP